MYIFTIKSQDAFGNNKRVEIKAENPEMALVLLKEEGYYAEITDIIDYRKNSIFEIFKKIEIFNKLTKVPKKDILRLIKMIGSSVSRGRTLKSSLEFIGENEDNKNLKKVIKRLIERMEKPFTSQVEIFSIYPEYFEEEFLGIIEAGETSSNLGLYLIDYVEEKRKQNELMGKFKSILAKRAFTLLLVFGVATVVVLFVIPQFKSLFGEELKIPWAMQVLLDISNFLTKFGVYIIIFLIL